MAEEQKNSGYKEEPHAIDVDALLDKRQKATRARFEKKTRSYFDVNLSWPMLIVLAGGIFGLGYALMVSVSYNTWLKLLIVALSLLAGVLLYNVGKSVGAALSGYELYRFECLGLQFVKGRGTSYSFSNFLEFHTNYAPKNGNVKAKGTWMYWSGSLLTLIGFAVVLILSFVLSDVGRNLRYSMMYGSILMLMIVVYELFPGRLDLPNDMYQLIVTNKEDDRIAYNEYLLAKKADFLSAPYKAEVPFDKVENSYTKPLTLLSKLHNEVYEGKYEEALKTVDYADENSSPLFDADKCEIMYEELYLMLSRGRKTESEQMLVLLDKRVKNTADFHPSVSALRTDVAIGGLLNNAEDELKEAVEAFKKECARAGKNERTLLDVKFVQQVLYKVRQVHPDWKPIVLNENDLFVRKSVEQEIDEEK
jgi:hypothetical protein